MIFFWRNYVCGKMLTCFFRKDELEDQLKDVKGTLRSNAVTLASENYVKCVADCLLIFLLNL